MIISQAKLNCGSVMPRLRTEPYVIYQQTPFESRECTEMYSKRLIHARVHYLIYY